MKRSIILLAVGAVLLSLFSGCTNVNTVSRAQNVGVPNVINDKRIITDQGLGNKISILQVAEGMVSGDMTKIQVTLANNRNWAVDINYKFEWLDMNGMEVSASSSQWKALRLQGKETKSISAIGPTPNAVDFTLKLQEPNR